MSLSQEILAVSGAAVAYTIHKQANHRIRYHPADSDQLNLVVTMANSGVEKYGLLLEISLGSIMQTVFH